MKPFMALVLILSVMGLAGSQSASSIASTPLSGAQLSAAVGANFWGGAVCSLSAVALTAGVVAIAAAATGGTSLPLSFCFGTSLAAHIMAVCATLE